MSVILSKDDPLLPVDDVADMFGVKPYTVRSWLKDERPGSLQGLKINGQWRVQLSEATRFANQKYGD